MADSGLLIPDDALYNDRRGTQQAKSAAAAVLESVAQMGLGKAGRVSGAPSIWNSCVPPDLLSVYVKHAPRLRTSRAEHTQHKTRPLHAMFSNVYCVTKGVWPTGRKPTAKAFLRLKNAQKCRCILNATAINDTDTRKPPRVRLPALSAIYTRFVQQ